MTNQLAISDTAKHEMRLKIGAQKRKRDGAHWCDDDKTASSPPPLPFTRVWKAGGPTNAVPKALSKVSLAIYIFNPDHSDINTKAVLTSAPRTAVK